MVAEINSLSKAKVFSGFQTPLTANTTKEATLQFNNKIIHHKELFLHVFKGANHFIES